MKQVGIIGGMSWESTAMYYQRLNRKVGARLGGLHSAPVIINSVDFQPLSVLQHDEDWNEIASRLVFAAKQLEAAGVAAIAIATNTMHKVAREVATSVSVPLLHIAQSTAAECQSLQVKKVALLGTRFTMEQPFFREYLNNNNIEVITPALNARQAVHDIIYRELCQGQILPNSKIVFQQVIEQLAIDGAQGVILGCTEIGMLITADDVSIPVLDTTEIHCRAIVDFILSD